MKVGHSKSAEGVWDGQLLRRTIVVVDAVVVAGENVTIVVERSIVVIVRVGGCRCNAAVAGDDGDSTVAATAVGAVPVKLI